MLHKYFNQEASAPMKVDESRQYIPEAWRMYTVEAGGEEILCNLNLEPQAGKTALLCLIPTQARDVVVDPASLKVKPNVMSQWLDRLTAARASVLLVHGERYDDLVRLSNWARNGKDGFALMEARLRAVVDHALENGYARRGGIVAMGSSRHGFAVLHSMARNPSVSAAVAHQPVIHWPRMSEFVGMDGNVVVERNSLFRYTDRFPPRPLLIQTGYRDDRVGQEWISSWTRSLADAYAKQGAADKFTHDVMDIPGHDGARVPTPALDIVVHWLRRQALL